MRRNNLIIDNARLVLADEIIDGHIVVKDGLIAEIAAGRTAVNDTVDAHGEYVFPGFIEVHTDHMDKCFMPRPQAHWPAWSAMSTHDGIMALAGVTTVCDAIAIGYDIDGGTRTQNLERMMDALIDCEKTGTNRVQHFLHIRCELPNAKTVQLFEKYKDIDILRVVSLMDHSPGQRQFMSLEKFREYYQGKYHFNDQEMADFEATQTELSAQWSEPNRAAIASICREKGVVLASHDDATAAHVDTAAQHGCTMAEFPTSIEAAKLSHDNNMCVVMGAPNVVRGGSHSGNIAAHDLAANGTLDILSSDYYPSSLVDAIFKLAQRDDNAMDLCAAAKLITSNPAQVLNLDDRGVLAVGKRADLALVQVHDETPRVEHTYFGGKRII